MGRYHLSSRQTTERSKKVDLGKAIFNLAAELQAAHEQLWSACSSEQAEEALKAWEDACHAAGMLILSFGSKLSQQITEKEASP